METKMRKIMVEVTPQEYQKILAGGLGNLDELSTEDLVNELVKRGKLYSTKVDIATNRTVREYIVGQHSNGEIRLLIKGEPEELSSVLDDGMVFLKF